MQPWCTTKITEVWNKLGFSCHYPTYFRPQISEIPVVPVLSLLAALSFYIRSFEPRWKNDLGKIIFFRSELFRDFITSSNLVQISPISICGSVPDAVELNLTSWDISKSDDYVFQLLTRFKIFLRGLAVQREM